MPTKSYLPNRDQELFPWLQNFVTKLPNYVAKYNLNPTVVQEVTAGTDVYGKMLGAIDLFNNFKQSIVAFKNHYRDGLPNDPTPQLPIVPPMPYIDLSAKPGIIAKVRSLVTTIKGSTLATEADQRDLGILGADIPPPTHVDTTCTITVRKGQGGQPEIVWTKSGFDGIEIQKKDAAGNWALLALDTQPNYTDTTALPPTGQPALWAYRAIYRLKDEQIGQWSDPVSITVM